MTINNLDKSVTKFYGGKSQTFKKNENPDKDPRKKTP